MFIFGKKVEFLVISLFNTFHNISCCELWLITAGKSKKYNFLRACEAVRVYKSILSPSSSSSSSGHLVESINIQAREVLEHRLLRPLSSEMRSEVTSEVTGSLRGHFQRNCHSSGTSSQLRNASSSLLHSLVVKALDFGARGPWFESRLKHL